MKKLLLAFFLCSAALHAQNDSLTKYDLDQRNYDVKEIKQEHIYQDVQRFIDSIEVLDYIVFNKDTVHSDTVATLIRKYMDNQLGGGGGPAYNDAEVRDSIRLSFDSLAAHLVRIAQLEQEQFSGEYNALTGKPDLNLKMDTSETYTKSQIDYKDINVEGRELSPNDTLRASDAGRKVYNTTPNSIDTLYIPPGLQLNDKKQTVIVESYPNGGDIVINAADITLVDLIKDTAQLAQCRFCPIEQVEGTLWHLLARTDSSISTGITQVSSDDYFTGLGTEASPLSLNVPHLVDLNFSNWDQNAADDFPGVETNETWTADIRRLEIYTASTSIGFYNEVSDPDVAALTGGSLSGSIFEAVTTGHMVYGLRGNGNNDSWNWVSGGGNYTDDQTYDVLAAKMTANGRLTLGDRLEVPGGNSDDWNTVFSWGDHSVAGYSIADETYTKTRTDSAIAANSFWDSTAVFDSEILTHKSSDSKDAVIRAEVSSPLARDAELWLKSNTEWIIQSRAEGDLYIGHNSGFGNIIEIEPGSPRAIHITNSGIDFKIPFEVPSTYINPEVDQRTSTVNVGTADIGERFMPTAAANIILSSGGGWNIGDQIEVIKITSDLVEIWFANGMQWADKTQTTGTSKVAVTDAITLIYIGSDTWRIIGE